MLTCLLLLLLHMLLLCATENTFKWPDLEPTANNRAAGLALLVGGGVGVGRAVCHTDLLTKPSGTAGLLPWHLQIAAQCHFTQMASTSNLLLLPLLPQNQYYNFTAANDFQFMRQHTIEWFLPDA